MLLFSQDERLLVLLYHLTYSDNNETTKATGIDLNEFN